MDWTETATIVAAFTTAIGLVVGLESFWIARSLDALRTEMHRGFDSLGQRVDRVEARLDRIEGGPPSPAASDD